MTRVLFIDSAPFIGGAQESFSSLVGSFPDAALIVGDGLSKRFPSAPCIHVRHWRAGILGAFQFLQDRGRADVVIRQVMDEYKPDIIHANTLRTALLLTSLRPACPVLIHDRDINAPTITVRYVARKLRPRVIAISSAVAEKWRGLVPQNMISVVPNGFDQDAIRTVKPAVFPWNGPTIILAADMVPWKRHALFIKAFAIAKASCPQLHAVVRGRVRSPEGERYLQSLQSMAAGLQDLAFVCDDGPALPHIAASNVLVACADNEPFGRSVLEAAALSKIVVATPTAASPDLLQALQNNAVIADDTPDDLARAIIDAISRKYSTISLEQFSLASHIERIRRELN